MNFIRIFKDGPDVSLSGSPTVSPTTAALCIYEPFLTTAPCSSLKAPLYMYFLALSHAPPVLAADIASWTPLTNEPGRNPARITGPNIKPSNNGVSITYIKINITKAPGAIIYINEDLVDILIQAL